MKHPLFAPLATGVLVAAASMLASTQVRHRCFGWVEPGVSLHRGKVWLTAGHIRGRLTTSTTVAASLVGGGRCSASA